MPHPPQADDPVSARRRHVVATWTALLVTVLWSTSWVLIRFALDDGTVGPLTLAGARYGLAAAILAAGVGLRPRLRRQVRTAATTGIGRIVALGVVFYAVTQGAQFVAIATQPAATTSLLLSATPLLVTAVSVSALGERPAPRQLAGAAVIVVGAWLYFSGDLGGTLVGMVAAVLGLVANAVSAVLGRAVNRDTDMEAVVITTLSMAIGAVLLVAVGLVVEGPPRLDVEAVAIVVWLAVVNTAVANTLWNRSLRHLSAVESAGINNTMLVQIALLAWIFLDESPGLLGVAGILATSLGVFLTRQPQGRVEVASPGPDDREAPDAGSVR